MPQGDWVVEQGEAGEVSCADSPCCRRALGAVTAACALWAPVGCHRLHAALSIMRYTMHGSCAEELGPHRRAGADRAAVMGPCTETGWSQDGTGGQSHLRLSRWGSGKGGGPLPGSRVGGGSSQASPHQGQQRVGWVMGQALEEMGVSAKSQEGTGQHRHFALLWGGAREWRSGQGANCHSHGLTSHGPPTPGVQGPGAPKCRHGVCCNWTVCHCFKMGLLPKTVSREVQHHCYNIGAQWVWTLDAPAVF